MRFLVLCSGVVLAFACASQEEEGAGGSSGKDGGGATGGSGGGFVDGGGWIDSGTGDATEAGPTCANEEQDGDETGVDCGGSCKPCGLGEGCATPDDCLSYNCVSGQCCTLSSYTLDTGLLSGTADICCNGTDTRLSFEDCGVGANHSANAVDPNCAHAAEGEFNGGNCCAKVVCEKLSCGN